MQVVRILIIILVVLISPILLISWIFKLYKKKVITRNDNEKYLIRYNLFDCKLFSVKIHNILLSDYDCLHDHPWAFFTFIMKGGYVEYTPEGSRVYGVGSFLYRPASYIHKLELHQPAWTFVITFKKVRKWGFFTKNGWVEWFNYVPANTCE